MLAAEPPRGQRRYSGEVDAHAFILDSLVQAAAAYPVSLLPRGR